MSCFLFVSDPRDQTTDRATGTHSLFSSHPDRSASQVFFNPHSPPPPTAPSDSAAAPLPEAAPPWVPAPGLVSRAHCPTATREFISSANRITAPPDRKLFGGFPSAPGQSPGLSQDLIQEDLSAYLLTHPSPLDSPRSSCSPCMAPRLQPAHAVHSVWTVFQPNLPNFLQVHIFQGAGPPQLARGPCTVAPPAHGHEVAAPGCV